jgi:hypothetical protein
MGRRGRPRTVQTFDGFERLAKEANEFRYSALEKLLLGLDDDRRRLAIRISLVPLAEDADAWRILQGVILADLDPNALDDLKIDNILDREARSPRFGHPTRRDAAQAFLRERRREGFKAEAEGLAFALARSVSAIDVSALPQVVSLAALRDEAERLDLGSIAVALCQSASMAFGRSTSPASLIEGAREARRSRATGLGIVLSTGLYDASIKAKEAGQLADRDASLDELRALARAFPDDAAVREQLASGLFNTQIDAKAEDDLARRDGLLDELRTLARTYADDAAVRAPLAMGLFNTLNDAKAKDDLARRDGLLDELRALARAFPEDAAVRLRLAMGLFNTLSDAEAEDDLTRRDDLLDELRALARAFPDDAAVRQVVTSLEGV